MNSLTWCSYELIKCEWEQKLVLDSTWVRLEGSDKWPAASWQTRPATNKIQIRDGLRLEAKRLAASDSQGQPLTEHISEMDGQRLQPPLIGWVSGEQDISLLGLGVASIEHVGPLFPWCPLELSRLNRAPLGFVRVLPQPCNPRQWTFSNDFFFHSGKFLSFSLNFSFLWNST